jgi:hypothetical protein
MRCGRGQGGEAADGSLKRVQPNSGGPSPDLVEGQGGEAAEGALLGLQDPPWIPVLFLVCTRGHT